MTTRIDDEGYRQAFLATLARDVHRTARLQGEFVLRSGSKSTTYFDKYLFEAEPALLRRIAAAAAPLVPSDTAVLAGLEMGGIPIVTALSQLTGLPCAFVRKEAKAYGTAKYAEGADLGRGKVLLVEDVVSTGGALLDACAKLHADGVNAPQALCIIDRDGGGREALAERGVKLTAVFGKNDLEAAAGAAPAAALANDWVALEPLEQLHAPELCTAGSDPAIWRYLRGTPLATPDAAREWIARRQRQADAEVFCIRDRGSLELVGSTSLLNFQPTHRSVEIGYTWYRPAAQRTYINSATKLALLSYAFERLQLHRVQLQTDARNLRSQQAIERLGATREGVLRQHKTYPDGFVRDSVVYGITADDWPALKSELATRLAAGTPPVAS